VGRLAATHSQGQSNEAKPDLEAENFTLELSLEVEESLEREFLIETGTEEVLGEPGVHGLESVASDGVVTMTHTHTALRPQDVTHLAIDVMG